MSEAGNMDWDIMVRAYQAYRNGERRLPLDEVPAMSDAPLEVAEILQELQADGYLEFRGFKFVTAATGAVRGQIPTSPNPGVAITSEGIRWVEDHAEVQQGDAPIGGFVPPRE